MHTFFSQHPYWASYIIYLILGVVIFEYYSHGAMRSAMFNTLREQKIEIKNRSGWIIFYSALPAQMLVFVFCYIFATTMIGGHLGLFMPIGKWFNLMRKKK